MNATTPLQPPDKRSHEQFLRLFLQAERELLRYVMALVPNVADARDVVQEAAVALWEKFDQYDASQPFAPWAARFALNEARMFLRSQSRRRKILADDVVELLQAERVRTADRIDARRMHLQSCLRELPSHQAELIRAYYFEEHSAPQLSARLGRSVEAIYKSLQRTRQMLQECIARKLALEGEN